MAYIYLFYGKKKRCTVEDTMSEIVNQPPQNEKMISKERNWKNPFGDGKAGSWIVEILI